MIENEISYVIRGCIFKVHNSVGPGLLESAYELALSYELEKSGLTVECQLGLPFIYEGVKLDLGYRVDMMISNRVIIEVKSVENLKDIHFKQLLTYLKLSDKKLGILVNFNTSDISTSIKRVVNNL
ncbi:MAG: GxxExxY protein [Flavobacterium sp.]|nr:MAG: GxxExxY protein [Flavobacterium sp.]